MTEQTITDKPKSRNPRRTVLQGVKAGRNTLSEVFKNWNQPQRVEDPNYMGGVTRGLAESERRENQPEAWESLKDNAAILIELGETYRDYADANLKRLNGEDVDMSEFEPTAPTTADEDVPLPE